MIIKPWGFKIWERIKSCLNTAIEDTGHENCYFPLFLPLDLIAKEAEHVDGFAKEMAVVTHHRLEQQADGSLEPAGELDSPLVVRPTSEAMITPTIARWIQSYRDLPILLNQWANVVRWEMRPRPFLRTSEFLWQEGHTAHETKQEAVNETLKMINVYRDFVQNIMAIPVIVGTKSPGERFPGAVDTYTIEAMMQDGKALQSGTSHNLGQNFAKAAKMEFQGRDGSMQTAYTTSWGVSTRLIGAAIMVHSDDDGLRLPPRLAPHQIVILPIIRKDGEQESVMDACESLRVQLERQSFSDEKLRVFIDSKNTGSGKRWNWIKKGVPLIVEVGMRDIEKGSVAIHSRAKVGERPTFIDQNDFVFSASTMLAECQDKMFASAKQYMSDMTNTNIETFEEMSKFFDNNTGFVRAKWCEDPKTEDTLKELGIAIRCLPEDQSGTVGRCVISGMEATTDAIFGKSY